MKYYTPDEIKTMSFADMMKNTKKGSPSPFYTSDEVRVEHKIHFDWNAWRSGELPFPGSLSEAVENCRLLVNFIRKDSRNKKFLGEQISNLKRGIILTVRILKSLDFVVAYSFKLL